MITISICGFVGGCVGVLMGEAIIYIIKDL